LLNDELGDEWRPDKSKVVICTNIDGNIVADCDQRGGIVDEKNVALFKKIAAIVEPAGHCFIACHGNHMWAINDRFTKYLGNNRDTDDIHAVFDPVARIITDVSAVPPTAKPGASEIV
jgi:hypothetical protein